MTAKVELLTPSGGKVILDPTDTAVDRTLTLPALAGTVFNQGNIVGTVSQSGGVPTGGIIERGSNANGEFVKYADGTLICTRKLIVEATEDQALHPSFPATFTEVHGVASGGGDGVNRPTGGGGFGNRFKTFLGTAVGSNSMTQWEYICRPDIAGSVGDFDDASVRLYAIGRWF